MQDNCAEFEAVVAAQCDALIEAIRVRRAQLVDCIRQDKEMRVRALREQVGMCTSRLQHTTGLLQFCIEALKESDSAAFLQVCSPHILFFISSCLMFAHIIYISLITRAHFNIFFLFFIMFLLRTFTCTFNYLKKIY